LGERNRQGEIERTREGKETERKENEREKQEGEWKLGGVCLIDFRGIDAPWP